MIKPSTKLILASRSPRRRELLEEAGYRFEVCPPSDEAECGLCSDENPAQMVTRLAYQKAADVVRRLEAGEKRGTGSEPANTCQSKPISSEAPVPFFSPRESIVLACDTVVECNGQILGKPFDEHHARQMLKMLSGQEHQVLSGLCLWKMPAGQPLIRMAITKLRMDTLSDALLEEYIASGQWEGKAGSFGYQDRLGWVHIVEGSESNVVGLPMELLAEMLEEIKITNDN